MAQIIKYNSAKESNSKRSGEGASFSIGATLNSSTTTTETTTVTLNANSTIWGQKYTGDNDITGTLKITEGDLIIKKPVWNEDDDDEDEGIEDPDDTDGMTGEGNAVIEGNLTVGEKSVLNVVEAKDIASDSVYGKTGYINYPTATSKKENIADLIKKNADDIATNKTNIATNTTNISNLTTTVNGHTTAITNLQTSVATNTTNIATNASDIADLRAAISGLGDDISGFSADTTIDDKVKWEGMATDTNKNSGFIFKGDNGTTTISPKAVANYSTVDSNSTKTGTISKTFNVRGSQQYNSNKCDFIGGTGDTEIDTFTVGSAIKIRVQSVTASATSNASFYSSITPQTIKLTLYRGNSIVYTSSTVDVLNRDYIVNYNVDTAGTYSVNAVVEGYYNYNSNGDTSKPIQMSNVDVSVRLITTKNVPPTNTIGDNGFAFTHSNGKYIYSTAEATVIKYADKAALRVDENGVKIQNPNTTTEQFVPLHSVKKIRRITNQNYTIQDDDEIVINYGKTKDLDWYLPKTTWTGRIITIIDIANDSAVRLHITANNENLFYNNSYNLSNSVEVNNTAKTFLFDGVYWVVMAS